MTIQGCPVCGGAPRSGGEAIAFGDIWPALEAEFAVRISSSVKHRYTPAAVTVLSACSTCELRFFSPAVAGGPDFYEALDVRGYYNGTTWEGQAVAAALNDDDDFVDFGCGDGTLLRSLPQRAGRSVGVDHYEPAVRALREAGLEACSLAFPDFARREGERFDVASAMQVLEHLPAVGPLMDACKSVLRPGGRLFIAVPNADRLVDRLEPQDCPPHHMSRWRTDDLIRLADRFGFEVARIDLEPGHDDMRRLAVRRSLEQRLAAGRLGGVVSRALAHAIPSSHLPAVVDRLGVAEDVRGHSLLVEMRLPKRKQPGE